VFCQGFLSHSRASINDYLFKVGRLGSPGQSQYRLDLRDQVDSSVFGVCMTLAVDQVLSQPLLCG
jgi:hypothetical protein